MMRACGMAWVMAGWLATLPVGAAGPAVVVTSGPGRVLVEKVGGRQDLNFEWFLRNDGAVPLRLDAVEVSAYDAGGRLLSRRSLDDNGVRPGIATVPERRIGGGETLTLFNPLASFAGETPIARLEARFRFGQPDDHEAAPVLARAEVAPVAWRAPMALRFPLRGRVWNYDGHDQFAHHRRFDYTFAPIAAFGFRSNFMRYADDFVPVDAAGRAHPEGREANADWIGFGAEVLAVAPGVVVAVEGAMPDDRSFDQAALKSRPMVLFGNHVVLDHGDGVFSVYGHLQQGSVLPAVGARVAAGEVIGRIGASGSAMFPHLHFQLQDGPTLAAEGLPATFDGLHDLDGAPLGPARTIESGRLLTAP